MKSINIVLKTTNACNLRCTYCYNSALLYTNEIMSLTLFEELLKKTADYYDSIYLIWHGGEPLLLTTSFYQEAVNIESKFKNTQFHNAMQSNATMIDDKTAFDLWNLGFNIGISYDGLSNENTRGNTQQILNGINNLKKYYTTPIGGIKVVTSDDLRNMTQLYEHFKELELDLRLSPLFDNIRNGYHFYSSDEYFCSMKELFLLWATDQSCNISVQPFENMISALVGGVFRECNNASCLQSFISMDPVGNLFPCTRYYDSEHCFGNIQQMRTINDVYESNGFARTVEYAIIRREACRKDCDLFQYCQGGCNHDAYIENGGQENGHFTCQFTKAMYPFIKDYLVSHAIENLMILNKFSSLNPKDV